jgi:hypothetical protein
MIGTIRKHSKWLWFVIIAAMSVSLLFFFSPSQRLGGSGGATGDFGTIYGKKISKDDYVNMEREFELFYFLHYDEWPDKLPADELKREVYVRLLLIRKADDLGVYVGDDTVAMAAGNILNSPELARALKGSGQGVPADIFVKDILEPRGLTAADFENFVRHDLAIQQLVQTLGLAGALVTPQEATSIYRREHEELSAQIVFFSASNYLSQVAVTPDAVAQFYTNEMAAYRLPDRVQISYVEFNVTNFLAQAPAELTNLDDEVQMNYDKLGPDYFSDAKTPVAAKAKIRGLLIRQRALGDAHLQANDFANAVFNLNPDKPKPEDLAAVAKQKNIAVKVTAPFSAQSGPEEFSAPEDFAKAAFGLTPDAPFAGPITGPDGVYVIAFDKVLPSEIPSLAEIRPRVAQDFQFHEATALAQRAGMNFANTVTATLARGKSFAVACIGDGVVPETLSPFSLSTQELPELGDRTSLNELKQAAFSAGVGRVSGFEQTGDGGFVVYVQSQLPVDEAQMNSEFPQFLAAVRRERQNEAFQQWLGTEAHKQLGDIPAFQQAAASAAR